jgi:ABC-type Fe3+ transport system permease subunit
MKTLNTISYGLVALSAMCLLAIFSPGLIVREPEKFQRFCQTLLVLMVFTPCVLALTAGFIRSLSFIDFISIKHSNHTGIITLIFILALGVMLFFVEDSYLLHTVNEFFLIFVFVGVVLILYLDLYLLFHLARLMR